MESRIMNREIKHESESGMAFVYDYTDLKVFQVAYDVSMSIHKRSLEFPKIEQYALADQLRRTTKSVCANIVEGYSKQKYSAAEFRRFISMSIGSCGETRMWLRYCHDLSYITTDEFTLWEETYLKIANMLRKLHSGIK